jgi:sugar lactone lactonase YvrE
MFDLGARGYVKLTRAGEAPLISPVGVCLGEDDTIFVCDSGNDSIYRLDLYSGELIERLETPKELRRPVSLVFSAVRDELFVVDGLAHDIKVLSRGGALLRTLGRRGVEAGEFNYPCDIAEGPGRLWVSDAGNGRVQALSYTGEPLLTIGQPGNAPGDFAMPKGIALDSEGHIYVVDARFENIQVFDQSGQLLLFFGREGSGPGEFWLPSGAFFDANDRLWVCDAYNRRIQAFDFLAEGENDATQPQ